MASKDITTYRLDDMQKSIEEINKTLKSHTEKEDRDREIRDAKDEEFRKEVRNMFSGLSKEIGATYATKSDVSDLKTKTDENTKEINKIWMKIIFASGIAVTVLWFIVQGIQYF